MSPSSNNDPFYIVKAGNLQQGQMNSLQVVQQKLLAAKGFLLQQKFATLCEVAANKLELHLE